MPHVHTPGLVLRFDPQTLADQGASYAGSSDMELAHQQYFVCIEANPKDALWLPLFPGPAQGRKGIAASAKTGNAQWTKHSSFYHPQQACRVAHKAAHKAAEAANDLSTPKAPNRLEPGHVPQRTELPADAAFRPMAGNIAIR